MNAREVSKYLNRASGDKARRGQGEQALWLAVLADAFRLLAGSRTGNPSEHVRNRSAAEWFLLDGSAYMQHVCDMAGVNASTVQRIAKECAYYGRTRKK